MNLSDYLESRAEYLFDYFSIAYRGVRVEGAYVNKEIRKTG